MSNAERGTASQAFNSQEPKFISRKRASLTQWPRSGRNSRSANAICRARARSDTHQGKPCGSNGAMACAADRVSAWSAGTSLAP